MYLVLVNSTTLPDVEGALNMTAAAATYRRRSDPAPVFSGPGDQGPDPADKSRGPDLQGPGVAAPPSRIVASTWWLYTYLVLTRCILYLVLLALNT